MAEYLDLLERKRAELMKFSLTQDQCKYCSTFGKFEISMNIADPSDRTSHDAYQLLELLSTLHDESMPLGLLESAWEGASEAQQLDSSNSRYIIMTRWHVSQVPELLWPYTGSWDRDRLFEAVNLLESLALVRRDEKAANPSISMHPLVHEWAAARQAPEAGGTNVRE